MEFDAITVALLVRADPPPDHTPEQAAALQDAHLAHLAALHEDGVLLAAGPLDHDGFRGLCLLRGDPETARAVAGEDPAVRAGRFRVEVMAWRVPAGAVSFSPTTFPRSVAEALA